MKSILVASVLCLTFVVFLGKIPSKNIHEEIARIDAQIEELKEMKRGFEGKAIRAENQADRLQFEDQFLLETRRYYQIAEENREKARKVQEEIDRLEAKKAQLQNGSPKKSSLEKEDESDLSRLQERKSDAADGTKL